MKSQSRGVLLLMDLLALGLSWGPGAVSVSIGLLVRLLILRSLVALASVPGEHLLVDVVIQALGLIGFLAACLTSLLLLLLLIRSTLPRLKAGVFQAGWNRGFLAWQLHSALARAPVLIGAKPLLQSLYLGRYLYWRAMGARNSWQTHASIRVDLHDAPLVTIEEGCVLAEDVEISCHRFVGDRLFIAPVVIGRGTFIGRGTQIGPRTRIGANSWIDADQELVRVQLPEGSRLSRKNSSRKGSAECES